MAIGNWRLMAESAAYEAYVPSPVAIVQAVETFGVENILFGSDFPDLDVSLNIGPLLASGISEADKRAILGGNMARVLAEYVA